MGRADAEPARGVSGSVPHLTRSEALRLALRAFGFACLATALLLGGYLGWLWWGTGFITSRAQHDLRQQIEHRIAIERSHHGGVPSVPLPVLPGGAVAIIRIPEIHLDAVVVEGTTTGDLTKGPGHYTGTAYPWQATGRVGIAGHRTTYGRPFWSLDQLTKGSSIRLITEFGWFRYVVYKTENVLPTSTWVLNQTHRPTLVLTTCTPRFSASERLAVFANRVEARPR